jgi:PadR family transcriptional regulator PadR
LALEISLSNTSSEPAAYIPLSDLAFHLLLALGTGAQHGYAIGKEIERRSGGRLSPATGSLYQVLRRLHRDGLIEDADRGKIKLGTDSRRQYFQMTRFGREVFRLEASRLRELLLAARDIGLVPEHG